MKDEKVKNALKKYRVPQVSDSLIDDTVRLAKKEFERINTKYKMSFREILIGQIKYVSPYLWVMQTVLLLIISGLLLASNSTQHSYQSVIVTLSVSSPVIALLAMPELAKSFHYRVWEMESTCKFNLQSLLAIRLIIFGVMDLIIITIIVFITGIFYDLNLMNIILYMLVPFNLASSIYLTILRRIRGKAATVICLAAGMFIALVIGLLAGYSELYTIISIFIWLAMFILSAVVLIYELMNIFKSFQEGENIEWNLP